MDATKLQDALASGTVDQLHNLRQSRYTHVLLLREVASPSRFTSDGETMTTAHIQMGDPEHHTVPSRVVDFFYRKQPGAERRKAKEIQRRLLPHIESCATDEMSPNAMDQSSVESVLFGSAAGDANISQRSRVLYNSAYSLRSADVALDQNIQTSAPDTLRLKNSDSQGTWQHDFVNPGTMFPCIVTLDSCTPEEVMYTLAVLQQTERYGGGTTRGGNVRNHVLGIFAGGQEAPSNYELTQLTIGELARELAGQNDYTEEHLNEILTGPPLMLKQTKAAVTTAMSELLDRRCLLYSEIPEEMIKPALRQLSDDGVLSGILEAQHQKVEAYLESFDK